MRNFFILVVFAIGLGACRTTKSSSGKPIIENNNASSLNGSWQLQMLFASDNNRARVPLLIFNVKDNTFSGNSGCNSISGKFIVKESYMAFDKKIISTKMACADPNSNRDERSFLSALLQINKFTINKNDLELSQGEIVLMKFKRN